MTSFIWRLNQRMGRLIPDAFTIAVLLTFAVFGLAAGLTHAGMQKILLAWGDGFWSLLSFSMQMCLVLLTGFVISHSPPVRRGLHAFAGLARDGRAACLLMAATSMALAWVHWGLGIVGSAVLARYLALRQPGVHYPLLVACGYFGLGALWHAGLSGSAPLLAATQDNFLADTLGVIPLGETIFSGWNLFMSLATGSVLLGYVWFVYPKPGEPAALCPEDALDKFHEELVDWPKDGRRETGGGSPMADEALARLTPAQRLENSYALNLAIGFVGMAYMAACAYSGIRSFDLNQFNFVFFILAMLLHPNPRSLVRAASEGVHSLSGVVLQFPLYAGMYGIIKGTGLASILAAWFSSAAGPPSFLAAVYAYSGILNYFVPSGGSKWAIEAPYLIQAARNLGVSGAKLVLAYSWGDMVTDLIQPFWCLPLLAAARIDFKDILGYLTGAFVVSAIIGTAGIIILGYL